MSATPDTRQLSANPRFVCLKDESKQNVGIQPLPVVSG